MTLMIMGVATVLIGLVPTYAQIGLWAPALLLLLRVRTGHRARRGMGRCRADGLRICAAREARLLRAALPQIGLAIGLCLASGVVAAAVLAAHRRAVPFLGLAAWRSWLWVVLVAIGMYIRLQRDGNALSFAAVKQGADADHACRSTEVLRRIPGQRACGHGRALHRWRVLQRLRRVLDRLPDADAQGRGAPTRCSA